MSWPEFIEQLRKGDSLDSCMPTNVEEGATYTYLGMVSPSGAWCIQRITIATNDMNYAFGGSGYAAAWTARASQTYAAPDQQT